ncbi:hypothetical protein [Halopenitus persicus]|uniref:hypothetical protein n=1 Tax=Halopenitus persicus TaxID=1048396 RepID=UPI000BBB0850|nr:hypothetical protein [Halopenitus persicus]
MLLTVLGVGAVALGLAIAWYGLRPLLVVPRVLRSGPRDPSDVTADGSVAVCRGRAAASTGTVPAPFTGSPCLGFEFEVTERQPFGVGLPWFRAHLDDGVATRRFTLEGSGGGIDVAPSSKRFTLDTASTVVTVGTDETPPDRIRRFVDVRDGLAPVAGWIAAIPGLGARRYVERRIEPGTEYLIAGRTGRTDRTEDELALTGDLVITDRSPARFALVRLWNAALPTLVAAVFVGAGLWALVG